MSILPIEAAPKANKSVTPRTNTAKSKAPLTPSATRAKALAKVLPSANAPAAPAKSNAFSTTARSTKQDRVLALLSRPDGASLAEMMRTTEWQQHSVRGFLAGTVRKKLGFVVKSVKAEGDGRRYHIEKPRGR
jgi:hypothetical protein